MKRKFLDFLKENRFVLVMFLVSAAIIGAYYAFIKNYKIPRGKAKPGESFEIKCFKGKFIIKCKSDFDKPNHCPKGLYEDAKSACEKIEGLGIYPIAKTIVYFQSYEKCDENFEKESNCRPFSKPITGKVSGHEKVLIGLPKEIVFGMQRLETVTHEMTHALAARLWREDKIARIVYEFFAIYVTKLAIQYNSHYICYGSEWNQPAVSTFGGEYDARVKENESKKLLSECRYGQLEYLSYLLIKEFPSLHKWLWHKLESKYSFLDPETFKSWLKDYNPKAQEIVKDYYILKEADRAPKIVVLASGDNYNIFAIENLSDSETNVLEDARPQVSLWRKNKIYGVRFSLGTRKIEIEKKDVVSGDIIKIIVTAGKVPLRRQFIVP